MPESMTDSALIGDPLAPAAQPVDQCQSLPTVVQVELVPLMMDEIKTERDIHHHHEVYCSAASVRLEPDYEEHPPPPPYHQHHHSFVVQQQQQPGDELTASLLRDHGVMDEELEQMCALYQLNGRPNSPSSLPIMPAVGQPGDGSDFVDLDSLLDQTAEKYLVSNTTTTKTEPASTDMDGRNSSSESSSPADCSSSGSTVLFSYLTTGVRTCSPKRQPSVEASGHQSMTMTPPASPEQEALAARASQQSQVPASNTTLNPLDLNLISMQHPSHQRVITPPSSPDFDLPDR